MSKKYVFFFTIYRLTASDMPALHYRVQMLTVYIWKSHVALCYMGQMSASKMGP